MNTQVNVIEYDLSTLDKWSNEKLLMCIGYLQGQILSAEGRDEDRAANRFHGLYNVVAEEMQYRGLKVPEIEE